MDFVNGYKDIKGDLKIMVFRISAIKHIDVWNDIGDEVTHKYFKYN
ncbi:MAG: hypothetical protein IPI54_12125 [Chitinophagaceae bacterium]|nr:hypothetical protein [Chitinophagaceae bacterium]